MNMQQTEDDLSVALLAVSQQLVAFGLNKGTSGNASVRSKNGLLITPSGMPAERMTTESLVSMQMDGTFPAQQKPSSEWRFHLDILRHRSDVQAVIHTHSVFATALSTLRREVPAFHYMVAVAGGDNIRCAPYALFGSQTLSDQALMALEGRKACLLANHGMIAVGESLEQAFNIAVEVENLCQQYLIALQAGEPHVLTSAEMQAVHQQFKGYGGWQK
jgi:L-fuculose-phosphate aldolase